MLKYFKTKQNNEKNEESYLDDRNYEEKKKERKEAKALKEYQEKKI